MLRSPDLCCERCTDRRHEVLIPSKEALNKTSTEAIKLQGNVFSSFSSDDAPKDEYDPGNFSSTDVLRMPTPTKDMPSSYTIYLVRRTKQDKVSIDVDYGDGKTLKIRKLKPGLLTAWNEDRPDLRVDVGDIFVEINGKVGDSKLLLHELLTAQTLQIHVRKCSS
mmetsp:Transcript_102710/g.162152  ORF Transcript_102710/g.162152 Transcript_102710/m.162152 type:complete len:165 (-) Transcript_102710:28-522(-)